jgi:hypothetical protein
MSLTFKRINGVFYNVYDGDTHVGAFTNTSPGEYGDEFEMYTDIECDDYYDQGVNDAKEERDNAVGT